MKNSIFSIFLTCCLSFSFQFVFAQTNSHQKWHCGTAAYYQQLFKDASFRQKFEMAQRAISSHIINNAAREQGVTILDDTIPVAVHVLADSTVQSLVTDAIIQSQIDVLNEDYEGRNWDSTRIPKAFKPLFGQSKLVFQLAKTNQYGELTSGITRKITAATFNVNSVDNAKFNSLKGEDAWDPTRFLNIWVVSFGNSGLLGISVYPGDPRPLNIHGFVCDYRAFGRGAAYLDSNYNQGKTTTHELGHFFNLYHIWGDDGGACTGTDFPDDSTEDDTPNQADNTFGNPDSSGVGKVVTDACSPKPPGIMYQNYMDYTDDVAMVMFTKGQQKRMERALTTSQDRLQLLNSTTYKSPIVHARDARIWQITRPSPSSSQCTNITPQVILRNSGTDTLTTVQIVSILNNGGSVVYNWKGNLPSYTETTVTLPDIVASVGENVIKVYTTSPNNNSDQNPVNDTSTAHFIVPPTLTLNGSIEEGFDSPAFPPPDWRINNPDKDVTWQRNPKIGKKHPGSAWVNNWNNHTNDRYDDLIMPNYTYSNIDSIFLNFNVAEAIYSNPNTTTNRIDTLSILVSKDCGNSFTTLYKKWGKDLQTINNPNSSVTTEFFPTSSEWRRDSVNLGTYLGSTEPQFQVAFRFSGNDENNIFIDDVNLKTIVLPRMLKQQGYLILPTAFQTQFAIWHYQQPTTLQYVNIYNMAGQLVWQRLFSGNADTYITVNLSGKPAGVYIVKLGYKEPGRTISQRIVKY